MSNNDALTQTVAPTEADVQAVILTVGVIVEDKVPVEQGETVNVELDEAVVVNVTEELGQKLLVAVRLPVLQEEGLPLPVR